jgi:acetyl-CoA carboxylase biotin carboxylase subunit
LFEKILIANRGEIARRIGRTARRLGVKTVAVYSDADQNAAHVVEAGEAVHLGPSPAAESYLRGDAIIQAALATGARAIHPGYGFLSENANFASAVIGAGLAWVGPPPAVIAALGDKSAARAQMEAAGVPVNPGGAVETAEQAVQVAEKAGFPVMLKAAAGGGGIGMQIVRSAAELADACQRTSDQALRYFGDGSLLVERYLEHARHVEVQVVGLNDGRVVVIGERDCSVQRRFQKIVEESPSPGLDPTVRARMFKAASEGLARLGYRGAGTVECLVQDSEFVFLEVNARLQVEHPVSELVTGLDLVEIQLRLAAGEACGLEGGVPASRGHAIELRIYAEDPVRFLPRPGKIERWEEPVGPNVRVDAAYRAGDTVTPFYDPMLAKLCAWGEDRTAALATVREALGRFVIEGPKTNMPFLEKVLQDPAFTSGRYDTGLVKTMQAKTAA